MWFCNCMDCSIRSNSFHTLNCLTLCPVPTMTLFLQNCLSSSWHEMQWLHVERLHTYFIFHGDAKLDGELSVINLSNRSLLHYSCRKPEYWSGSFRRYQIGATFSALGPFSGGFLHAGTIQHWQFSALGIFSLKFPLVSWFLSDNRCDHWPGIWSHFIRYWRDYITSSLLHLYFPIISHIFLPPYLGDWLWVCFRLSYFS